MVNWYIFQIWGCNDRPVTCRQGNKFIMYIEPWLMSLYFHFTIFREFWIPMRLTNPKSRYLKSKTNQTWMKSSPTWPKLQEEEQYPVSLLGVNSLVVLKNWSHFITHKDWIKFSLLVELCRIFPWYNYLNLLGNKINEFVLKYALKP